MATELVFLASTSADAHALTDRLVDQSFDVDRIPARGHPGYAFQVIARGTDEQIDGLTNSDVTEGLSVRVEG